MGAFFHAHGTDQHLGAPYQFRPMGLEEVVTVLERDPDPRLRNHGAAWLLDNPERQEEYRGYLTRLLGPEGLSRMTSTALGDRPCYRGRTTDEPIPTDGRFARAYQLMAPNCPRRNFRMAVALHPVSLVTGVRVSVEVPRPPGEFRIIADPQNWKRAAPLFFSQSELGNFQGGTFTSSPTPPAPGSAPYQSELLELVKMSWNPFFPLDGRNVLCINYDPGPPGAGPCETEISLCHSLSTTIGLSRADGGLDVDGGGFSAEDIGSGWSRITARKEARFTERHLCGMELGFWLNLFAPFWLGPWLGLLTYEGVCAGA
jgi:hypothetical protein